MRVRTRALRVCLPAERHVFLMDLLYGASLAPTLNRASQAGPSQGELGSDSPSAGQASQPATRPGWTGPGQAGRGPARQQARAVSQG